MIRTSLGTLPPVSSLISTGVATAGAGVAAAAGAGLLTSIGITAAAVPFIGPIVAGIALTIGALGLGNGCGETCTASTAVVNQVEPYMQQNLAAAQQQASANGGCLTSAEVTTLEANFNQLWQYVVSNCQQVGGPGGKQCIADRQPGGKYDWTSYYLTPIQQIPVCSSVSASSVSAGSGGVSWMLLAGLGLLGVALFAGGTE